MHPLVKIKDFDNIKMHGATIQKGMITLKQFAYNLSKGNKICLTLKEDISSAGNQAQETCRT